MRAAFAGIVDYAGLFPPASCSIEHAVRSYDRYRRSSDRWMLGRFVVSAGRLPELDAVLTASAIALSPDDPWLIAVVLGAVLPEDLAHIETFRLAWEARGVLVQAIECRANSLAWVRTIGTRLTHDFRCFFEVPSAGPYGELVAEIHQAGACAKVRTGGTSTELFPSAMALTEFLVAVIRHRVPFKATAGLHHPLRGHYPLTYAPGAERAWMHGFVNVLLATAELLRGGAADTAQAILEERDAIAFARDGDGDGLRWRDVRFPAADLVAAHRDAFVGFGSCSFREPVDELGFGIAA